MRKANKTIEKLTPERQLRALLDARRYRVASMRSRLVEAARSLACHLNQIAGYVSSDDTARVNELGEIQARGPMFDALCSEYQEAKRGLEELEQAVFLGLRNMGEDTSGLGVTACSVCDSVVARDTCDANGFCQRCAS